jgi:hypothetical protein
MEHRGYGSSSHKDVINGPDWESNAPLKNSLPPGKFLKF